MEEAEPYRLLATIDMCTNSFKLLLCSAQASNFLPVLRLSSPVLIGLPRCRIPNPNSNLSLPVIKRSISTLRSFSLLLSSVHATRLVATSVICNAPNRSDLLSRIRSELGFHVEVLSGRDEARLSTSGFAIIPPLRDKSDPVGLDGEILDSISLDLGHVTLTESFGDAKLDEMRGSVRTVLDGSGLVEKVRGFGFEIAASGTMRSIGKTLTRSNFGKVDFRRLVDKIWCSFELGMGIEVVRTLGLARRRAEFIMAGAVLLMEIFEVLGIEEMEVSGYGLGEGVIAEMAINETLNSLNSNVGFDSSANARWKSVVGLTEGFDRVNRWKSAVQTMCWHCKR